MCKSNEKMKQVKISNGKSTNSILECKKPCNILWQRDINTTKNMLDISNSIWQDKGFKRKIAVVETVSIFQID